MAWNDLSISQRSQLMNIFRRNGVTSLSDMRNMYDASLSGFNSSLEETTDLFGRPTSYMYQGGGSKYGRDSTSAYGDKYYDVVAARYDGISKALKRKGFTYKDIQRLAPILTTQQTLEGGWRLKNKYNNYAGMLNSSGETIAFDSDDAFYDAYLNMLDEKWHTGRDEKYSWRNAQDLKDYARIVNREDLGLHTKEQWKAYNKGKTGNDFVYLYAPEWDNNNKSYLQHLNKTSARTQAYLDMIIQDRMMGVPKASGGSIHIDPSKKGTFTAAATKHDMGVQEFASYVSAHPDDFSSAMRKKQPLQKQLKSLNILLEESNSKN